jgi:putative alpha-1,2-mannosidase
MNFSNKIKRIHQLVAILIFCLSVPVFAQQKAGSSYTALVDPYIGSGGHGHVFVGAGVPFGGVRCR